MEAYGTIAEAVNLITPHFACKYWPELLLTFSEV
jgi:hypothetical protein